MIRFIRLNPNHQTAQQRCLDIDRMQPIRIDLLQGMIRETVACLLHRLLDSVDRVLVHNPGSPLIFLAQLREHGQVLQRRRVLRNRLGAGSDVAKQPAHDLAGARFGQ